MTMHGMFWRFPASFSLANSAGISPRSSYLKVVGDFCQWQDQIVFGCDDTAKSEFLNRRKAKGHIAAPQSQSNLWFVQPEQLDRLGPVLGRGAVWLNDSVEPNIPSDPYLISGFSKRAVHIVTDNATRITFEIDVAGNGQWVKHFETNANGYSWHEFDSSLNATWIRARSSEPLGKATLWFHSAGDDAPSSDASNKFAGVAQQGQDNITGGLIRPVGENKRTLQFAAVDSDGPIGNYILDAEMRLKNNGDDQAWNWLQKNAAIPAREGVLSSDEASVIYTDDDGKQYRLPKNPEFANAGPLGFGRLCREVATERDLFNCHGTLFELPANNAGGFARIRPVCSHNLQIHDYCSYRGLLVISGISQEFAGDNRHIIRSDDGKAALWVGAIDDVWELGKPVGVGGPWRNTTVKADEYSLPYLMTGYDSKELDLTSQDAATITVEIDITGTGVWQPYKTFSLQSGTVEKHRFARAFQAYWIRFKSDKATKVTAQLIYR